MIVSTSHRVCTMKNIDFTDFFNVFLSGATIRDSLFLFFESTVKFHFPFAAGGAVSAPAAASTAADGGMIDVTAGKNEEDGDHRHHSIDSGIHGFLLFMYSREVKNKNKIQG